MLILFYLNFTDYLRIIPPDFNFNLQHSIGIVLNSALHKLFVLWEGSSINEKKPTVIFPNVLPGHNENIEIYLEPKF